MKHATIFGTLGVAATIAASTCCPPRPARAATDAAPPEVHLRYAVYVHGFHAIELDASLRLEGDRYVVQASDHMVGFVGAFLSSHVTSSASGTLIDGAARPVRYASAGFSRGADRQTLIDYPDGNPVVKVLSPVESARDPVPAAETAGSIDTLSAVVALLHEAQATGRCDGTIRVFDGARLSVLTARTAGIQPVATSDRSPYAGTALRCDVSSREIAGFLHDQNFEASHHPQTGSVFLATVVPGAPPMPIRGDFSTVDHGPVSIWLLSASASGS